MAQVPWPCPQSDASGEGAVFTASGAWGPGHATCVVVVVPASSRFPAITPSGLQASCCVTVWVTDTKPLCRRSCFGGALFCSYRERSTGLL